MGYKEQAKKDRVKRSVKRSQRTIRAFEKRPGWPLTGNETRNLYHKGLLSKDVKVKFKKRSSKLPSGLKGGTARKP